MDPIRTLSDRYEKQIEDFVIAKVTGRVAVNVHKPKWLPEFAWRWMWKHVVVIEERPSYSLEWKEKK